MTSPPVLQSGHDRLMQLQEQLGISMSDLAMLDRAVTHRSYAFENGGIATNERLEFLGDAVLAIVVTDRIFRDHPTEQEGRLAKLRAAAVKAATLATVARGLGLGDFVLLGKGETTSGGADKDSILADTFEAVLGAVYLDQGLEAARTFVERIFHPVLSRLADRDAALDYKTSLQELAASEFETLPVYRLSDTGPDHEKTFTANVSVGGKILGEGVGRSKKIAEQAAARQAYQALSTNTG